MNSYQILANIRLLFVLGLLLAGCNKPMERETVKLNPKEDGNAAPNTLESSTSSKSPESSTSKSAESVEAPDPRAAATRRSLSDQAEVKNDAEITQAPHGSLSDQSPTRETSTPTSGNGAKSKGTSANVNDKTASPSQLDPNIAALDTRVDYLTLEIPPQTTTATWKSKQWIDQIALTDRAMRSLMLDQQANNISNADYLTQAKRLSELKLTASEQLKAVANNETDSDLAILGKLEALSQFAQLGDRLRANELLTFANEHANFKSKVVARQASLVLLGFSLNQINSDSANPQSLLQQVDSVLADRDKLRLPEFKMMEQVIVVLQRKNLPEIANQVTQKTIEAFRNNPDSNIAYPVWSVSMANSPSFQAVLAEIAKVPTDPALLKKAIADHLAIDKSDWFMIWLSKEIRNLEARRDTAALDIVAQTITNAQFASQVISGMAKQQVDAYNTHAKMIGQPLVLTELADLNGNALDLAALKGKVVLVTFWASWCPVCRAEFPELNSLYSEYKSRGFEIVGVNVDDTQSAMQSVMQIIDMPWPNFHSSNPDLFGLNTLAAKQVSLNGTPFSILIDRTGNVVDLQLHGQPLKEKLDVLLPAQ